MSTQDSNIRSRRVNSVISFPDCFQMKQITETKSEPISRSGSFSRRIKPDFLMEETKRRYSLPIATENAWAKSYYDIPDHRMRPPRRVRSFKTSAKGVTTATKGDRRDSNVSEKTLKDFNRFRHSSESSDDSSISCSCSSTHSSGYFRVCIMGANAVGKRTLISQFTRADLMSYNGFEIEELDDNMISVVIDNDESTVEFVDITEHEDDKFPVDAYLVVYSVHERSTYDVAIRYLEYVRNEQFSDRPIIIVANKVDLVRKRQVSNSEARHLAVTFNCKYIDTSATLNHHVDKLLVGILAQIKQKLNPEITEDTALTSDDVCNKRPKGLLNKLLHLKLKATMFDDVAEL